MLKIPTATDKLPPLVNLVSQSVTGGPDSGDRTSVLKKRRRGRKLGPSESHSWEQLTTSGETSRHGTRQNRQFWIGGSALAALLAVGVFFMLKTSEKPVAPPQEESSVPLVIVKKVDPVEAKRSEASLLTEAEPLARKFLEAKSVTELLPIIRHPNITEPRMREVYPDGKVEAVGMSRFNSTDEVSVRDKLISLMVRTGDQLDKPMAFIDTPEGLKIDWESWVGWSEMSWEKFLATKPTTSQAFRVTLSAVDYYNFAFLDESKWHSYRLLSPDGEHSLYGYAEKGSVLDLKICPTEDMKVVTLMLSLKFPAGALSNSQVEIVSFIAEGWVEDDAK
jgi:hypothetical protein